MRIAVLEDSLIQQEKIHNILKHRYSLYFFKTVDAYLESKYYYDLLLLDIELGNENGISFIQKYPNKQRFVVYVSYHVESMMDTFDTNVLGFIPKKQMDSMLMEKVKQVETRIQSLKNICLRLPYENLFVCEDEILYFQIDHGVRVCMRNHEKYVLVNETLKELEEQLPDLFIRINNNTIINLSKVDFLDVNTHTISLCDTLSFSISVRRWKKVKDVYFQMRMNI